MKNRIFITGTGTDVGKTIATAALGIMLKQKGYTVCAFKPIETGCRMQNNVLIPQDGNFLKTILDIQEPIDYITPVKYAAPAAPLVAQELEKRDVDIAAIKNALSELNKYDIILIEGIGGLMVPIKKDYFVYNLIEDLNAKTILVSLAGLGAINHTLLSLELMKNKKLPVAGIIINNREPQTHDIAETTNPEYIRKLTNAPILGILPFINDINYNSLANLSNYLDYDIIRKIL
ncbi:Dethiobiotin synthase [Candidatus Magnetoovum chiemensis]|nr:Dethiobiotin synthase [Candidatus Magnetoovum chiemensis]